MFRWWDLIISSRSHNSGDFIYLIYANRFRDVNDKKLVFYAKELSAVDRNFIPSINSPPNRKIQPTRPLLEHCELSIVGRSGLPRAESFAERLSDRVVR
jgi:hypothetical protein